MHRVCSPGEADQELSRLRFEVLREFRVPSSIVGCQRLSGGDALEEAAGHVKGFRDLRQPRGESTVRSVFFRRHANDFKPFRSFGLAYATRYSLEVGYA